MRQNISLTNDEAIRGGGLYKPAIGVARSSSLGPGDRRSRKVFGDNVCHSLRYCNTFTEQKQLKLPNVIKGWPYTIIGSCNGLLCLFMGYSRVLLLWNPSIKKFKILPKPRLQSRFAYELTHGFAFVPRANDYKVVRLIHDSVEGSTKVEIYTLTTNSWRTWIGDGIGCARTNCWHPVFINGAVHWKAQKKMWQSDSLKFLIIAFHMDDEVFKEITPISYYLCGNLSVVGEKLAYIVYRYIIDGGPSWDLWVLEDYGGAEFWTKLHTIRLHNTTESYQYHLQSLKNGEILFGGLNRKELYSFDLERQEIKQIEVDGLPFEVINYTESLVLLNEGIHDSSDAMSDLEKAMEVKVKVKVKVKEKLGIMLKAKWIIKYAMDLFKCKGIDVRV
ncbi:hypothetical protein RHGRI_025501 [Rhododendron griersonianum]|uniref:F-box associated beta-propeller type 3 domain-containing protein n=1 Tax=Rhododendron griersonianum TaxID=479676 RepID=A0AAV6IUR2_9ERIC|nr:hypothetical protein RHGRI_025501 [Rhododendron griersonianum]